MLGDLNELKTFRAILTSGSLSSAARSMGVSLAVVSKRLQALERRTRVRLINRTTRALSPTDAGARLLSDIEVALDALASAEDYLARGRSEPSGTLRVCAPVFLGRRYVAPIMARLTQLYPSLSISLALADRQADLVGEGFDIAVTVGGHDDSSAVRRKLADCRSILVASPDYLGKRGHPRWPADLVRHNLLRQKEGYEPWILSGENGNQEFVDQPGRLHANDGETLVDWATAGFGIAFRPEFDVMQPLALGTLKRVLPEWSGVPLPIVAMYPTRRHLPFKVRVALDALTNELPVGIAANPAN